MDTGAHDAAGAAGAAGATAAAAAVACHPLVPGERTAGEVAAAGEVDDFCFTVPAGRRLYLDVLEVAGTSPARDWLYFTARGPTGSLISRISTSETNPDGADTRLPALSTAGTYTLQVTGDAANTASYAFVLQDVAVDRNAVAFDAPLTGEVTKPGDVDEWTFQGGPGRFVFLDALRVTGTSDERDWLYFTLRDPDGSLVRQTGAYENSPSGAASGRLAATRPGTYTLEVTGDGDNTAGYDIVLYDVPAERSPLVPGAAATGAVEKPGSLDEWTFDGAPGQRLFLDVQQIAGTTPARDWLYFTVRRPDGTELARTGAYEDGPDAADGGLLVADAPGTYTVEVVGDVDDTASYRLLLRTEADLRVQGPGTAPDGTWPLAFKDALPAGRRAEGGYRSFPFDANRPLPWTNVDRAAVQLEPGLSLAAADVVMRGTRGAYAPADFAYDPATGLAAWRFAAPLQNDTIQVDAGPRTRTRLLVLPGDANGDRRVNALDVAEVKRRLSRRAGDGVTDPTVAYTVFSDLTADGVINAVDVAAVKRNLGRLVSVASAFAPVSAAPTAPAAPRDEQVTLLTGITADVLATRRTGADGEPM